MTVKKLKPNIPNQSGSRRYSSLDYYSPERLAQYYYQIQMVRECHAKKVLEIGTGPGVVTHILRTAGIEVITCDCETRLHPDICCDVKKIPWKDNAVDLVLCCQVLEHLPFTDFILALKELKRMTRHYILISLPYAAKAIYALYKLPFSCKKSWLGHFSWLPFNTSMDVEHKWEIGRRNYPKKKVIQAIQTVELKIKKEFVPVEAPNNQFFLLEKK